MSAPDRWTARGGPSPSAAGEPGSGERASVLRGWSCHWLFYAAVVVVTAGVLANDGTAWPLVIVLAGLTAGWYALAYVGRTAWIAGLGDTRGAGRICYVAVALALWMSLLSVDRSFAILGVVVVGPTVAGLSRRRLLGEGSAVVALTVVSAGFRGSISGAEPLTWQGLDSARAIATASVLGLVILCVYLSGQVARARADLVAAQRQAGALAERHRLAADLHDTLTQNLASVVMLLEASRNSYRSGTPEVGTAIDQALATARDGLRDIRGLVWDLRPDVLEQERLDQAVARLTRQLGEETAIATEAAVTGEPRRLPTQTETTLLRVAAEALANARRHARAARVNVTLSYMNDLVAIDVHDDGVGFDPSVATSPQHEGGFGLVGMRERVEAAGGVLSVESSPGEGTAIAAQLPVNAVSTAGTPIPAV